MEACDERIVETDKEGRMNEERSNVPWEGSEAPQPSRGRGGRGIGIALLALLIFLGGVAADRLFFPPAPIEEALAPLGSEIAALRGEIESTNARVEGLSEGLGAQVEELKGEIAELRRDVAKAAEAEKPTEPAVGAEENVEVSVDDDPALGSEDAPVVIVEFSDFQCPFCKRFHEQTLPQIKQEYIETGKVRLVYRDFPIMQIHPYAGLAALAAECADDQGRFWGMHDLLFERQSEWPIPQARELFAAYARELGVDEEAFSECMTAEKHAEEIFQDLQDGVSYGVEGTPAFFINGEKLEGAWPFEKFQEVIDAALAQQEQ